MRRVILHIARILHDFNLPSGCGVAAAAAQQHALVGEDARAHGEVRARLERDHAPDEHEGGRPDHPARGRRGRRRARWHRREPKRKKK